jgi:hypothetical protein
MIPSLPDIEKKDHLDMRTVFGIWTKGPEGPALLTHLLEHLHNALAKARLSPVQVAAMACKAIH